LQSDNNIKVLNEKFEIDLEDSEKSDTIKNLKE
jgi:hypothetical protein